MLTTVIFDMDGLLIDSEPLWGEAMNEVLATMGVQLTQAQYAQTTGLRTLEVVDHWQKQYQWNHKSARQVTDEIQQLVLQKIRTQGRPKEGLLHILDFFRQRRFKMGLASSSPLFLIENVLDQLGIRDYLQVVKSAEAETHGKPHPAVYLACAQALQSDPLDCLVFEDSITGVIAAKAARMKVVAVPEPHRSHDPRFALADLKLSSLADFMSSHLAGLQQH